MIHDIDVVLNLVQSPVEKVEAIGISVLGKHEDMVNARLHFASGCVANLTASRVSYSNRRVMQVVTSQCCATIDFATRRTRSWSPRKRFSTATFCGNTHAQSAGTLARESFHGSLVQARVAGLEANAIEEEQLDFATAIRTGAQPRVTGSDGHDAL